MKFTPYANEADVLQIGGLQLENRLDRVTLSGDLDLTADQRGLADARALRQALDRIVAALEARSLPAAIEAAQPAQVKNPFA